MNPIVVLLLAAAGVYVVARFVVPRFSRQEAVLVPYPGSPSTDEGETRVQKLHRAGPGSFVKIFTGEGGSILSPEYEVLGRGEFGCYIWDKVGKVFRPKGESYPFWTLGKEVFMLERPDEVFLFSSCERLFGESARQFNLHGREFSRQDGPNQIPGSVSFEYNGKTFCIQDVGWLRAEPGILGSSLFPSGTYYKFMLCTIEGTDQWVLLTNQESGTDHLWFGVKINDLETALLDVLVKR